MKNKLLQVFFLSFFIQSGVHAATPGQTYIGGGYHFGILSDNDVDATANPSGLEVRGGKYLSDTVAIEGQFMIGMGEDTIEVFGTSVDVKLNNLLSVFLRGEMKLSPTANIYGLIGFSKGEIELSTFAGSVTEDDSGLSFGFGVDTEMSKGMYIGGRFVSYIDDDADYSGININITKYLD